MEPREDCQRRGLRNRRKIQEKDPEATRRRNVQKQDAEDKLESTAVIQSERERRSGHWKANMTVLSAAIIAVVVVVMTVRRYDAPLFSALL